MKQLVNHRARRRRWLAHIHRQRLCWLIRIIGAEAYDAFACAGNADARVGFIQALRRADIVSQADTGFCGRGE